MVVGLDWLVVFLAYSCLTIFTVVLIYLRLFRKSDEHVKEV
jgi:hypothetical protein